MLAQGRVVHLRLQGYLLLMLYDLESHPQLLSPLCSLYWHYVHYAQYASIMLALSSLYWHYAQYASITGA